jgi:Domain of unknown function (DUF4430)
VRRRCAPLLVLLVLLAGCGGAGGEEEGTARLWVTRDRGAVVLVDAEVRAGQTLMRALASQLEIETRYGGRYLQAAAGLEGDVSRQRDWFWFVNGYEGDRSATEYRLRAGDVAWWDFRRWEREGEARVVVGAFPEPFLHGYGGRTRPAAVRYEPGQQARARKLAARIGAATVQPLGTPVARDANVLEVRSGPSGVRGELLGESSGDPVRVVWSGDPDPERRFRVP